jgi:hypothetical protein
MQSPIQFRLSTLFFLVVIAAQQCVIFTLWQQIRAIESENIVTQLDSHGRPQ